MFLPASCALGGRVLYTIYTASAGCNLLELLTLALVCARGITASCLELGGGLFEKISYLYVPVGLAIWEGVQ